MKMHSVVGLIGAASLVSLLTLACGDDESGGAGSSAGGGTTTSQGGNGGNTTTGGNGSGGDGPTCDSPEPPHMNETFSINVLTATVMGTDGSPAAGTTTKVCGTDICSEIKAAEANGDTTINASQEFVDARFVHGNGKEYAEFAVILSGSEPNPAFGDVHVITLPSYAQGVAMEPGVDAVQNGVTLAIPADAVVDHDNLLYTDESQRVFRTESVLVSDFTFPAVDPSLNMEMLVALAPINTVVCPAAALTVPNTAGFAAGATVKIYVHGHLTFKHYAPYGEWEQVATGVVSGDGQTISTADGEGIELLATYGFGL